MKTLNTHSYSKTIGSVLFGILTSLTLSPLFAQSEPGAVKVKDDVVYYFQKKNDVNSTPPPLTTPVPNSANALFGHTSFLTPSRAPISDIWLGVHVSPIPEVLASQLDILPGTGLVVQHVIQDSPAQSGGLLQHDVLLKLNDQILINSEQFQILIQNQKEDAKIDLHFLRKGKPQTLSIPVGKRPRDQGNTIHSEFENRLQEVTTDFEYRLPGTQHPDRRFSPDARAIVYDLRNRTIVISDDSNTFSFTHENGKKHLTIADSQGKTLFEGPINTEDEFQQIPENLRNQAKNLQNLERPWEKSFSWTLDSEEESRIESRFETIQNQINNKLQEAQNEIRKSIEAINQKIRGNND